MARFVADKVVKLMIKKGLKILDSKVLLLGVTFKENCPDIRNTKVVDIVDELQEFGCKLDIYDPWADKNEVEHEYGIQTMEKNVDIYAKKYDAVILAVSHEQFAQLDLARLTNGADSVIFDIKGYLPKEMVDGRL